MPGAAYDYSLESHRRHPYVGTDSDIITSAALLHENDRTSRLYELRLNGRVVPWEHC